MNDLTITVTGWVATDPRHIVGPTGASLTSFRIATHSRYFDRSLGEWADGPTEWFTVRTFRAAAVTVMNSITKGQPIVVTGRLRTNEWTKDSTTRTDLIIDATALGHDLTRGVATFRRAVGDSSLGADDAAGTGMPGGSAGGISPAEADKAVADAESGANTGDGEMGAEADDVADGLVANASVAA